MSDDPIRRYCDEVAATVELDRRDLCEIEDHLRELADDQQESGFSRAEAMAEACRRFGAPHALAREYLRVRPAFGARLLRTRAWSAALLLAWPWVEFARLTLGERGPGLVSIFGINLVISGVALGGLIARATWARAIILGALSWWVIDQSIALAWNGVPQGHLLESGCKLGALAFLVPWQRREVSATGFAIVLLAWTYHGVNMLGTYQLTAPSQLPFATVGLGLAFVGTLTAGLGLLWRSRLAALAALVALVGLALGYADIRTFVLTRSPLVQFQVVGAIVAGQLAAVVAAVLAWRNGRRAGHSAERFRSLVD